MVTGNSDVLTELQLIRKSMEKAFPSKLLWGVFPGDGGYYSTPAGTTRVNFTTRQVNSPAGTGDVRISSEFLTVAQSLIIIVDTLVFIEIRPGVGKFFTGCAFIEGPSRNIEEVIFDSDTPFNFIMAIGSGLDAPRIRAFNFSQIRGSDNTIVKTAAAGSEDTLTSITFVPVAFLPSDTIRTLSQSLYGKDWIGCAGWTIKTFLVRNLGTVAIEVQLFGGMSHSVAESSFWVADTDTPIVYIGAGGSAVLESGVQWGCIQMRARVHKDVAAASGTRFIVEYFGLASPLR